MSTEQAAPVRVCEMCGVEFEQIAGRRPRKRCYECNPLDRRKRPPVAGRSGASAKRRPVAGTPFTVEHFRDWSRDLVLDVGDQYEPADYFLDWLADVFKRDDAGLPVYPEAWLLVPEENGKTTSLAILALYHLEHTQWGNVLWAASARDQALLGYEQAAGLVERTPGLGARFKLHPGYRRIRHVDTYARLQVQAADDRTGDGPIPTLAILDELHRHRTLRLYRTWRGKLTKRGGQLLTISTAGEPYGEFETTRDAIRHAATVYTRSGSMTRSTGGGVVMHDWAVAEGEPVDDMRVVKAANPFPGVTEESLRRKHESPTMTLAHWSRFVCNRPTREVNAAIQESEWRAAAVSDVIPPGTRIHAGLDVAWKWDTTALVPLWWRDSEYRLLGPATILTPPRDGTSLDPNRVEAALVQLHNRTPIERLTMDTSRAEQLAEWARSELGCDVLDRRQTNPLAAEDYSRFMEALRSGWLKHSGDPGLTQHVLNAVARILPLGDARFDRPAQSRSDRERHDVRVIDALAAAAMVHSAASVTAADDGPLFAFL